VGCGVWGVGKWESGEVGKWGSGEVGKWGSGGMGRINKNNLLSPVSESPVWESPVWESPVWESPVPLLLGGHGSCGTAAAISTIVRWFRCRRLQEKNH